MVITDVDKKDCGFTTTEFNGIPKNGEFQLHTANNAYYLCVLGGKVFSTAPVLNRFVDKPVRFLLEAVASREGEYILRKVWRNHAKT